MDDLRKLIRTIKRIEVPKGREYCHERKCEWRRDGTQACCLPCCMKKAVGSICKKEEA